MCGICGLVYFDSERLVESELLKAMTDALAHRGPDDEGYFQEANVGLGHRRLSIIDLGGGAQPIFNEDHSALIVFNGEVYNYADLTSELMDRGHQFRTRSDTETILHAYEEYGEQSVERLRGMFTFAIWDRRSRSMFAARDRLGIKPFYYYHCDSFFAFASEIKSLLEIPGVPRELDPESLSMYLSLRYVPGPRTMFKGIYKLQPGHLLSLEGTRLRIQPYWDLPQTPPCAISDEEALQEFRRLLEESVRLRLIAEVPLGVFLSGGLDSSAILATMSQITGAERIKTFSVGYEGETADEENSNEFYYARMAAQCFHAEHYEYRVTADEFCDAIPDLVWHLDEPLADPSCIPLYFISKLARQHITVVLSGEGADEILAGYTIYRKMLTLETLQRSMGSLGRYLASGAASLLPNDRARLATEPLEHRYHGVSRAFLPASRAKLLSGNLQPLAGLIDQELAAYWRQTRHLSPLRRMLYLDTKVWLPDDILLKADKVTMANALELRVPFLDHKLVEFAATLPDRFKLQGNSGKVLLRRAMNGVLPDPILTRTKKGFPVPTEHWLRTSLREYTRDLLLSPQSACHQYFRRQAVETLLQENETGRVNRHQEIWTLLIFEEWHRMFLSRQKPFELRHSQPVEVV